jgi:hypothetical protein
MNVAGPEGAHAGSVIAFFVTPHGFGHGGRAAAVMAALNKLDPSLRFEIFTEIPEWFFRESLSGPFVYHPCLTDIGMVQESPLHEDLSATVLRLDEFLPFGRDMLNTLGEQVKRAGCELILCDIAPLGIAVGQRVGIPSVLIENFTWDWIYEGYAREDSRMIRHVAYLHGVFTSVNYHIQTEPVSVYGRADLLTPPVSRTARTPARETRERLGMPGNAHAVLITMGGMKSRHGFLSRLKEQGKVFFVIPGSSDSPAIEDNLVLLPHHSHFFHPDLIDACDAVIGKVGYSTVAEVYDAGVPFGYIPRTRFRESEALTAFARERMNGIEITEERFEDGGWLSDLPKLMALPRIRRNEQNGAAQVARFVYGIKHPIA